MISPGGMPFYTPPNVMKKVKRQIAKDRKAGGPPCPTPSGTRRERIG